MISKILKRFLIVTCFIDGLSVPLFLSYTQAESTANFSPSPPVLSLSVKGTTVSGDIHDKPLVLVLQELATRVQAELYVSPAVENRKISASFTNHSIECALKSLLKGGNYALTYTATPPKTTAKLAYSLKRIYVLSFNLSQLNVSESGFSEKTDESYLQESSNLSPEDPVFDGIDDISMAKSNSSQPSDNPDDRLTELYRFISEHGEAGLPIVLGTLMDPDNDLRQAAVGLLLTELSHAVPTDVLAELTLGDEKAEVRKSAMRLLADYHGDAIISHDVLRKVAHDDSDPNFQRDALELLDRIENPQNLKKE